MTLEMSSMASSDPALDISNRVGYDFRSDKVSVPMAWTSAPDDKALDPTQFTNDVPIPVDSKQGQVDSHSEKDSPVVDGSSLKADVSADISSPPPKPAEEEIVRNIEVLCQFIAKIGPEFENMARTKEAGNPKFAFLFGGEPGSDAAVAHGYFLWMKRKCELEYKLHHGTEQNDPVSRPSQEHSVLHDGPVDRAASVSPALSDIDMEDDIGLLDKDLGTSKSAENACEEPTSTEKEQASSARHQAEYLSPVKSQLKGSDFTSSSGIRESFEPLMEDLSPVNVSPATSGGASEEVPHVFVKDGSPFRLIQDYASDDSAEDDKRANIENVSPVRVSPSITVDTSGLPEDGGVDTHVSTSPNKASETEGQPDATFEPTKAVQQSDFSLASNKLVSETVTLSDTVGAIPKRDRHIISKVENKKSCEKTKASDPFEDDALQGDHVDAEHASKKFHKEKGTQQTSPILNVDEFGRLIREGVSDSDSDGAYYSQRVGKRGRSRSPHESRRRRRSRSPWRRRDRRSRSRSWSPKKQKTRSKSPAFRRTSEFSSEKMRWDNRGQPQECFDFLKGKCYRGASCRYLHHDSAIGVATRRHRNKREQYREIPHDWRNSVTHGDDRHVVEAHNAKDVVTEFGADRPNFLHEEGKVQDTETRMDLSVGSTEGQKDVDLYEKIEPDHARGDVQQATSNEIGQLPVTAAAGERGQSQSSEDAVDIVMELEKSQQLQEHSVLAEEKQVPQQNLEISNVSSSPVAETPHLPSETALGEHSGETSAVEVASTNVFSSHSEVPELPTAVAQTLGVEGTSACHPPIQTGSTAIPSEGASMSQPLLNQMPISTSYLNQMPMSQPYPNQINASQPFPSESLRLPLLPQKELHSQNLPTADFYFHPQRTLPPYAPPLFPRGSPNAPHALQPQSQYQLQPPGASFQSQPFVVEGLPHKPHIVDYHSQAMAPAQPSWTDLPQPPTLPSYINEPASKPLISTTGFLTRDDQPAQSLMRNNLTEELTHSRITDFQRQTFSHTADPHLPLHNMEDLRPKPLAGDDPRDQPFGVFMREERFMHPMIPENSELISKLRHDYHMHPTHLQSFQQDNLPYRSFSREGFGSTNMNYYSQQQQLSGSFPSHLSVPGNVGSSLARYSSGLTDVGSKVSTSAHYNPFASTFEQTPTSTKFSSSVRRQEIDSSYSSKLSRELITGDQYDPLFDSIEPSSNNLRKIDGVPEHVSTAEVSGSVAVQATKDTGTKLRHSTLHVPLDVEEDNRHKEGMTSIVKPPENDEFDGATTDAEIGAVENVSPRPGEGKSWSPGLANDLNAGVGEIEIDQVPTSGKSKSKDSRSMKLFKIAIADFVKEVLKPSWRQGNMSKEAFKTIVKKTVDKVSGAMQSHQIPKTQGKINQYVESSQRKLTKLVMGYVDKYVKV